MPRIKLFVVPKPAPGTMPVIEGSVLPVFQGGYGDTDYLCGSCGVVLMDRIDRGQVRGLVLICPACKAFNQVERPAKSDPIH